MIGIYKITNKINNKCYIGQSIHIEQRWQEHLYKSSQCSLLKYALYKYGKENFIFEIIEECPQENLNNREQYWISYYNSFNDGYNLTLGGDGTIKYSVETIYETYNQLKSVRQTANKIGCAESTVRRVLREYDINCHEQSDPKSIEKIDPNTLKVIKTYLSIQEAADENQVNHSAITMALNGTHKSCAGYYWKYTGEKKEFPKEKIKQWKTKIQQLNYDTEEVIAEFESAANAAAALGKDRKNGGSQIIAVCNGRKKSAFGYKWKKVN